MKMADPSVAGAAYALAEHLRTTFPSVPYDTIRAITAQHSSDPGKCLDLVRLESCRPTMIEEAAPICSNGLIRENKQNDGYSTLVTGHSIRPQGSYVIRRSVDALPPQSGVIRDTRSCTPPRGPPSSNQQQQSMATPPMNAFAGLNRPSTLGVRPVLQHRPSSPVGGQQPRLSMSNADSGIQSYPGTPTGGQPNSGGQSRASLGFYPGFKINYQPGGGGGSQITLSTTHHQTPSSPTWIVSSGGQSTAVGGGNRPVFYQLARTNSQQPAASGGGSMGVWQYERRPSFADVELAQRSSNQSSSNILAPSYPDYELHVSADNLHDGSPSISPNVTTPNSDRGASPLFRIPTTMSSNTPNIRIQLDPRSGGAVISGDPGAGGRFRPRVTFSPLVAIQQQRYARPTAAVTLSLRQPQPSYDGTALSNATASTYAQAEECLKSVLTHQRTRLAEMKKAIAASKIRLDELRTDVDSMEQDLSKRRKHSVRSAAISDEAMSSLHKETRELQAEIQTMLRLGAGNQDAPTIDVGLGGPTATLSTGLTIPLPVLTYGSKRIIGQSKERNDNAQKVDNNDKEQWACSLCTFLNHVDLPICEFCDMPRVKDVDGWQFVYDISPSAFN